MRTNQAIDSGLQLSELGFYEGALGKSGAEESSVNSDEDPGAFLESDGGEEDTAPEENFEDSNKAHGGIVIFFDEFADSVCESIWLEGLLCVGGSAGGGGGWLRGLDGRDQVGASVRCDVEDGVDTKGEHGKGVLRRDEPDKRHSCSLLAF